MKLLNLTTRYFLTLIFALLIIWCAVLYFSMRVTIYMEADEYLSFREKEILAELKEDPFVIDEHFQYSGDFKINSISEKEYKTFVRKHEGGEFKDVKKYIPSEGEKESFRLRRSVFQLENNYYEITILTTLTKSEDILFTVLIDIFSFSILFFILVFVLNKRILSHLWKPFYETLFKIKQYKLDTENNVNFEHSNITEFKELNDSISSLIQNNLSVYQQQKHFIENASHEMQTPVGIIQSKLELLMEEPNLNKEQALLIDDINEQIDRLSRLNKTLLLLSKIENNQFTENNQIDLTALFIKCCDDFKELLEFKNITLQFTPSEKLFANMNEDLAKILFSNLIKNAINHNHTNGYIHASLKNGMLRLSNTGDPLVFDPHLLFERFNKKSDNPQSNGLGLSIVKKICTLYHYNISYTYTSPEHTISIIF